MRAGLVLGGGGVVGQAYHAGVLAQLEHDFGWDPRHADVVVGTSAGAITATLLRAGVPAADLAAWTVKTPLSVEGRMLEQLFGQGLPELEPFGVHHLLRPPALPGTHLLRRALLRPWQIEPVAALLTLVAPGRADIVEHLAPLRELERGGWPRRPLWICTVRRRDGRRVVFGRPGAPAAPLHLAVAASCAVPGYFAPVRIGARTYVDGGAHSPTNAAVLRREGLDVVLIVSPMSGARGLPRGLTGVVRRHASIRLRQEVRALRAAGMAVVVFEPGPDLQATMGPDLMSGAVVDRVVGAAFVEAGRRAARPTARRLLRALAGGAAPPGPA